MASENILKIVRTASDLEWWRSHDYFRPNVMRHRMAIPAHGPGSGLGYLAVDVYHPVDLVCFREVEQIALFAKHRPRDWGIITSPAQYGHSTKEAIMSEIKVGQVWLEKATGKAYHIASVSENGAVVGGGLVGDESFGGESCLFAVTFFRNDFYLASEFLPGVGDFLMHKISKNIYVVQCVSDRGVNVKGRYSFINWESMSRFFLAGSEEKSVEPSWSHDEATRLLREANAAINRYNDYIDRQPRSFEKIRAQH